MLFIILCTSWQTNTGCGHVLVLKGVRHTATRPQNAFELAEPTEENADRSQGLHRRERTDMDGERKIVVRQDQDCGLVSVLTAML